MLLQAHVALGCRIAPSGNFAKQPLGFIPSKGWRQFAMQPDSDAPRSSFAPSEAVLHEVDLAARRRDLEAKAREFLVPYVTVSASRPGGVHSAFGDAPLGAKACLLSSGVTAR